jgi:ubiquitin-protein ligase
MVIINGLSPSGRKRLSKEMEMLKKEEDSIGIKVSFSKNSSAEEMLNEWDIQIDGPPDTIYENFVLHAKMHFPNEYPFKPPTFQFVNPMFHPNIYVDGKVCISILHNERDDPTDLESAKCSWTPGQNVRTVCLSIISLLNAPNIYSPANVDASKLYRDDINAYKRTVKEILSKAAGNCSTNQNK